MNTIYALSSGLGVSAVSVIRISGENLSALFSKLTKIKNPNPRFSYTTSLYDNDEIIDKIVAIYFKAPHSFTGEDIIELHTHGSPAVVKKVLEMLSEIDGVRMANRGEFARRAFENGKMDLYQADALIELLNAKTEASRKSAISAMKGNPIFEKWGEDIKTILAKMVASLDFEEDALPLDIDEQIKSGIEKLKNEIKKHLDMAKIGRAISGGFKIALIGDVNAGKSSVFNKLVGSDKAIVSDICGTTRDTIEANLDLDGYLVSIYDTAGIRETEDTIEKLGIERANKIKEDSDLKLYIVDSREKINPKLIDDDTIVVYNKIDLSPAPNNEIGISALNNLGIDKLLQKIKEEIKKRLGSFENPIVINERIQNNLTTAYKELQLAEKAGIMDIRAEHLREAKNAIGAIIGTISLDEILDSLFSQLCLGK